MKSFFIGSHQIKLPIIQGGMGVGISLSQLASAVANEGGVGVISCAGVGLLYADHSPSFRKNSIYGLREEIRKARKKTTGVLGVNIMSVLSHFSDMAKTAVEENIDIIFSGAGLPLDLPSYLTPDSQTKLVPIVSSARAAKIICEKWLINYNYLPDAIVIEGPKAGGHLGFKEEQLDAAENSLETILKEVDEVVATYSEKKQIPLIVAGGISSGKDIRFFLRRGAAAVQMGSAFVTTSECDASDIFKQVYLDASEDDIKIIKSPVGMPGRAINGEFIKSVELGLKKPQSCPFHCIKSCDYTKSSYCILKALHNAYKGNMANGYAFAGSNAFLAKKITTVKELITRLKEEFMRSSCLA